eukprot:TRINITY_DN13192_c0_g2_i3.p1 TRINITY_DN13192_c0_g2~~TRINITY_DN13192_c0_g2_i3.p1  ORF type:complete len:196 (-),score=50.08 TRINITY_DN13192_c0_g2_i3:159-746(-)
MQLLVGSQSFEVVETSLKSENHLYVRTQNGLLACQAAFGSRMQFRPSGTLADDKIAKMKLQSKHLKEARIRRTYQQVSKKERSQIEQAEKAAEQRSRKAARVKDKYERSARPKLDADFLESGLNDEEEEEETRARPRRNFDNEEETSKRLMSAKQSDDQPQSNLRKKDVVAYEEEEGLEIHKTVNKRKVLSDNED